MSMVEKLEKSLEFPREIAFHYSKSNSFRVIHSDGVIGELTPNGNLFISFFSERLAVPDKVVYEVETSGKIGRETERFTISEGVLREMEIGIVLDIDTAKNMLVWLASTIRRNEANTIQSPGETE